jgi:hypothetical protein
MISAASSMTAADRTTLKTSLRALSAALGACALLAPAVARAEGPTPTPAEALFREGRVLLDAKNYDEACPKLAESQKLEPGAGTLLALALCHEGQGKTATASAELKRASELGRRNGRSDLAAAADKRAQALEASVPHLMVHLPENDGPYRVRCDGEAIAASDLAAPVAMDPGEHRIEVAADGKASRSYVVRISGPGTTEIVVDKLDDAAPAGPKAQPRPSQEVTPTTDPAPAKDESRGGAQRTVGLVLVGAGVVGLGAGAYFGGRALSESGEAKRTCPTAGACPDDGNAANERSKDSFRAAVIGLAAGTVALTAGAIVYFLAPSGSAARGDAKPVRRSAHVIPSAGPNGVSLGVVGTF